MPSPIRNCQYPFTLSSNIVYFHDWRYVDHGNVGWGTEQGQPTPELFAASDMPPLRYDPSSLPTGIRIVAQKATKSEPVIVSEPDEIRLGCGTLLHDGGVYRFWTGSKQQTDTPAPGKEGGRGLARYFESDNGTDWRSPNLGLIEYKGSKNNNLYAGGVGVFIDPTAGPEQRYKCIYTRAISGEEAETYRQQHPGVPQEQFDPEDHRRVHLFMGACSPDGFDWTELPEALTHQISDTPNVCEWDPLLGKYVAYVRNWLFGRRGIGRIIAPEFRNWPQSDDLMWPGPDMAPDATWYANGKTRVPGTSDYHVMFPMQWRFLDDKFEFHLAASPDNLIWSHVPGGAICQVGDPGCWDGGTVLPGTGMVALPGDRWGLLFTGTHVPHKYPRRAPLGRIAWAWWRKGRLSALEAPEVGSFDLWSIQTDRRRVHLNFTTAPAGRIEVAVCGRWPGKKPVPGRGFEDCDRLVGDELDRPITWKGNPDIGTPQGEPVTLRFRMRTAKLYSVEFK